jgi:hypothetical protein
MPIASIGAILFIVAAIARWKGKAPRLRAWMFFGAGCCLGAGLLARISLKVTHLLEHAASVGTSKFFGTATPLILVIGVAVWMFFELIPKGASGHEYADFVMFLLPAVLIGAGGSWALLAYDGRSATTSIMNSVIGTIQDLSSGW